jgi:hypothetical protein
LKIDVDAVDFWEKILPEEKNAKSLQKRIDAGLLSTEQGRTEFYEDLKTLTEETLSAWEKGLITNWQDSADRIIAIIDKAKQSEFTEEQTSMMSKWVLDLQNCRKPLPFILNPLHPRNPLQRQRNPKVQCLKNGLDTNVRDLWMPSQHLVPHVSIRFER